MRVPTYNKFIFIFHIYIYVCVLSACKPMAFMLCHIIVNIPIFLNRYNLIWPIFALSVAASSSSLSSLSSSSSSSSTSCANCGRSDRFYSTVSDPFHNPSNPILYLIVLTEFSERTQIIYTKDIIHSDIQCQSKRDTHHISQSTRLTNRRNFISSFVASLWIGIVYISSYL